MLEDIKIILDIELDIKVHIIVDIRKKIINNIF